MLHSAKHPIRLLVADDHEMLRDGFHVMLKKASEITLVGEAIDGVDLVEKTTRLMPDVVITDIKMPNMDGIEATRQIVEKFPHIGVIAFTMFDDDSLIIDMLEAGARGYLIKNASKGEILDAIHAVLEEKTYYCKQTSARLVQMIAGSKFNPNKKSPHPVFTKREVDLIILICEQFTNKEMAQNLNLSTRTIEGYREKIQEKMKVKNTAGIVVYAIRKGIYKI